MKIVLGRKQGGDNDAFCRVWDNVWNYVTRDDVLQWQSVALDEIRGVFSRYAGKNIAYGWSGGKDSIVLQHLLGHFADLPCVAGTIPVFEWPDYLDWIHDNQPRRLWTYENRDVTYPFIQANRHLLFPTTGKNGYWWTLQGTRKSQTIFAGRANVDLYVWGRRTADGNFIGGDAAGVLAGKNFDQYNPIRDWPHEMVFAYIQHFQLALPPIYDKPRMWVTGTGCWAGRRIAKTVRDSFVLTYMVNPGVVKEASRYFPEAASVLQEMG